MAHRPESGIKGERISLVGAYSESVLIAPIEISGTLKKSDLRIGFLNGCFHHFLPLV